MRSATGLHRIGAEGDAGCGLSAYPYFCGAGGHRSLRRRLAEAAH
ncbi:MAG: hypothetical protein K0R13_2327 [Propionibacteriaceae bacterium]|jgi:hypothetical protein|nr:hypothetical protein [Propionibacteriaceae bacterium]